MDYVNEVMPLLIKDITYALQHVQAYSHKIEYTHHGYPKFIYGGLDKNMIYINDIDKYPITQIVNKLKAAFPHCHVYYDDIQRTIRVRLGAE